MLTFFHKGISLPLFMEDQYKLALLKHRLVRKAKTLLVHDITYLSITHVLECPFEEFRLRLC
jgi:hypothetical protein